MRSILFTLTRVALLVVLATNIVSAQDDNAKADSTKFWDLGGKTTATFSQTTLRNWSGGGEDNITLNTYLSLYANFDNKKNDVWENRLDMGYGLIKQGDIDQFVKSDDKIEFISSYGRKAFANDEHWFFNATLNFRTQFDDGFANPGDSVKISTFMAPGYLTAGLGWEYKYKKVFKAVISPLSSKMTFVIDQALADQGAFGVDAAELDTAGNVLKSGKRSRIELGASVFAEFKKEILKNVSLESRLTLFSNYQENPENIDVNWENLIVMKINKYLSANFVNTIIYDDDIPFVETLMENGEEVQVTNGPRIQYKQIFGLGFSVIF